MNRSKIPYADYAWNPVTGCNRDKPCAARCWAAAMCRRFHPERDLWKPEFHPLVLDQPLRTRKPGVVATAFGGDLFAWGITNEQITAVFGACAASRHTHLILTKRPERIPEWLAWMDWQDPRFPDPDDEEAPYGPALHAARCLLAQEDEFHPAGDGGPIHCQFGPSPGAPWPLPNVLLGTSVSTQAEADERLPHLSRLAAAGWRTWVSVEPMIGPVDLGECPWQFGTDDSPAPGLSWVVCGAESGPGARPCELAWVRDLRNQCVAANVPFYWKQDDARNPQTLRATATGGKVCLLPELDGVVWSQMPEVPR